MPRRLVYCSASQQEIAPEPEAQVASPAVPPPEPEIAETVEEPQEKTKKVRLLSFLRLNPEPLKPSQTLHARTVIRTRL